MKRLILGAALLCMAIVNTSAQDVYQEILRMSTEVANNENKALELRKVATFKVDALNYMAQKSREVMPDSSAYMLDYQAFAMYEFVNLFTSKLTKANKKKDRSNVINAFKEATLQNPRFNDTDLAFVNAYCGNNNFLTQFSLDTDWIKALAYIREKLAGK
ncbi:MAG: hypothetical protein IKI48_00430 [Prevotella sp.]|uniref:hypothetical protein n=1 Tax=Prevotella sp. Rep29 TaxID=2691580 RepID=UPI001B4404A2|nr:hypothetical protein [Prevotella sp. Rep29]MBP3835201.1 hypothetical protein [Prevotella sp.]MBR1655984.1 hypothetical protein [Prevotella sp.]MBR3389679.1 hypothetical protein [Prevotella sp.]MBR3444952.1 hypothetical protein [Prevotella sp.]MBR7014231.1 hypothetical protein [Prevotella sp.]